jgi:arabinose-5-phosphate isomerase
MNTRFWNLFVIDFYKSKTQRSQTNYNTKGSKEYMPEKNILEIARRTLKMEADSIVQMAKLLDKEFVKAVELILDAKGRVVVTGIGKSAVIAQKIVSTLNSTGTPSMFMHAADAVHGDLGMIQKNDVVICISKSGNTAEIKVLAPLLKHGGNKLIAMVGDLNSDLAKHADIILNTSVEQEACPNNLAPTTSTTAQLAMGDALAVCLLESRKFTKEDFAKYHPGGALGKRLYLKCGDLAAMHEKPSVGPDTSIKDTISAITKSRVGAVAVLQKNKLEGMITDGDIRRMLEKYSDIGKLKARDIMNKNPKTVDADDLAVSAAEMMRNLKISQVIVIKAAKYDGMLHIHDLNREGII